MGTRIPSHQLTSGLYVSGRPEQLKTDKPPTIGSRAIPYTGGDVKKSGELGKMFDIPVSDRLTLPPSNPLRYSSSSNSGSLRSGSNSGTIRKSSGPMAAPLQPTGLITSGPIGSGSIGSGPLRRSGQLDNSGSVSKTSKPMYGSNVTCLTDNVKVRFGVPRAVVWLILVVMAMSLFVGVFLMVAVKNAVVLVAVGAIIIPVSIGLVWNCAWGKRGFLGYVNRFPDTELRGAIDGQFVKVTGVVTCGSIPLESSYLQVPRCVYVSTELYEYKGLSGKSENLKQHCFSWGSRHSENYVTDFYISDFQSGLRALVKAGNGAKVVPFVKPATVLDVRKENKDQSPNFLRWLADRKLPSGEHAMRLQEGYIKEGSTMSVMGVVRRHESVLMIVPPQNPITTGCQWSRGLFSTYVEGLLLTCDDNQNVVPV